MLYITSESFPSADS